MPCGGPGSYPAGKCNTDQERNFSPGEFTKHKEQKVDMGDASCIDQSGLGKSKEGNSLMVLVRRLLAEC